MFCSKCGKENRDDASFCDACGAGLNSPYIVQSNALSDIIDAITQAFTPCAEAWSHFIKNIKNFQGRTSRRDFWLVYPFISVLRAIIFCPLLSIVDHSLLLLLLYYFLLFLFSLPAYSLIIRRVHDAGYGTILAVLSILTFQLIAFVMCFFKSDTDNKWGYGPTEACLSGKVGFLQENAYLCNSLMSKINESAPESYEDCEEKKEFDNALSLIIPDFAIGNETPSELLQKTDPALIVSNIRKADYDTLIKAYNAFDFYTDTDSNQYIAERVKAYILTVLAGKMQITNTEG